MPAGRPDLLPRRFPAPAAWYACRCPIPSPRSCVATELAICICTTDRDSHKSLSADAAGDVSTGGGNLSVGDSKCGALFRFARSRLGHDGDIPKPVIGRLGGHWSRGEGCDGESGSSKYVSNAILAHE